jgi:hypothetical protein
LVCRVPTIIAIREDNLKNSQRLQLCCRHFYTGSQHFSGKDFSKVDRLAQGFLHDVLVCCLRVVIYMLPVMLMLMLYSS